MAEKNQEKSSNSRKLMYMASFFKIYDKEKQEQQNSSVVESAFVNENVGKNGEPFLTIEIKTSNGVYHSAYLNVPLTEDQRARINGIKQEGNSK